MQDGKYVIMYVEDDSDMLETMKEILECNDFVFVGADSAGEGIKKFKEVKPDFIFVDMMMEEVDAGVMFAKEVKFLGNKAPIYMLSSMGDGLAQSIDYNELGLDGVLQKPIGPPMVLSTIKSKLKI